MNHNVSQSSCLRSRLYAFVLGVPIITVLYTKCLILARASEWHGHPFEPLFTILFKPAYYLSLLLPRVAEWQHALGIVLITGALWGFVVVGLGLGAIEAVKKRSWTTQQGAAPNGGPATPPGSSGVTEGPPSVS